MHELMSNDLKEKENEVKKGEDIVQVESQPDDPSATHEELGNLQVWTLVLFVDYFYFLTSRLRGNESILRAFTIHEEETEFKSFLQNFDSSFRATSHCFSKQLINDCTYSTKMIRYSYVSILIFVIVRLW